MADSQSAQWWPDPFSRHELRYWDGEQWTEHVSDAGAVRVDPAVPTPRVAIDLTVAERLHSRRVSTHRDEPAWAPAGSGRRASRDTRSAVGVAPFAGLTAEAFDTPAPRPAPGNDQESLGTGHPFARSAPFRPSDAVGEVHPFVQPFADHPVARRRDRVRPLPDDDWAVPPVIELPDGVPSLADRLSPYTVEPHDGVPAGHVGQPGPLPPEAADPYRWAGPGPTDVLGDPATDLFPDPYDDVSDRHAPSPHGVEAFDADVEAHWAQAYAGAQPAVRRVDWPADDADLWTELTGEPRTRNAAGLDGDDKVLTRRRGATTTSGPGLTDRLRAAQVRVEAVVDWRVSWLPEALAALLVAAVIGLAALLPGGDSSAGTADVSAVVAPTAKTSAKPTARPSTAQRTSAKPVSGPKVSTARGARITPRSSARTTSAARQGTSTTTSAPVASPTSASTRPRRGPKSPSASSTSSQPPAQQTPASTTESTPTA